MNNRTWAVAAALAGSAASGHAAEFRLTDGVAASVRTVATLGTIVRTSDPAPSTYALIPSTAVPGAPPGQLVGQTGGSDLNFRKGHAVSTLLKAMVDIDVHGKTSGVFVRLDGWHDFTLGHTDARYGNNPNGFTPDRPLSDRGFAPDAKFSNVRARDAYAYWRFDGAGDTRGDLRIGRQVLGWGASQFFTGGIGAVTNPYDTAAQVRPGALPQEARVPIGMVSLSLAFGKDWGVDAYVPYEFRPANIPGCGTFFDAASVIPQGCNIVGPFGAPLPGTPLATPDTLTERALLANGYYLHRDDQRQPNGSGQYGVSVRYTVADWATDFRAYAARSDNTLRNVYSLTIENVNGATLPAGIPGALARLTDPNGLKYGLVYPKGVHVYGVSFDTKFAPTAKLYGEVAYRKDQPIGYSPIDLLLAGLLRSPTSILEEQRKILSVPAGQTFEGYDRHPVLTANLGGSKLFPKVLGADSVGLAAEIGYSHVSTLPDPAVFRYGRGLAYGGAPYYVGDKLTACTETLPGVNGVTGKTCRYEGYVSTNAWGLRGRASATYGNAIFGGDLTLSLTLAKDIRGYSYDSTFVEGRMLARTGLRIDWGKRYFVETAFSRLFGGRYNLLADRSNVSFVGGLSF